MRKSDVYHLFKSGILCLESVVCFLHTCRETSTNPLKKCKTNPIFRYFSPENDDSTKKQTQNKPNSNPNKANNEPKIRVAKPNIPNLSSVLCLLSPFLYMKNFLTIAFFALTLSTTRDYNEPIIEISCFQITPIERDGKWIKKI
jgi:hypothetical protein